MKKKKLGIISIFLVFAMLISSVLPYSGDMAAAKGKNIVSKGTLKKADGLEKLSNPRIEKDKSMQAGQRVTWDCVWFGSYPQAEVVPSEKDYTALGQNLLQRGDLIENEELYKKLQSAAGWDAQDNIVLGGSKYRRVKRADATYFDEEGYPTDFYQWDNGTDYHYFKYQPIKWRVLSVDGSEAFLLADKALDDKQYHTVLEEVTWEGSTVRSWLNGYKASVNKQNVDYSKDNFINAAFSMSEQEVIKNSSVENNSGSSEAAGKDTEDKIFLLSEYEVRTDNAEKYGFAADNDTLNEDGHVRRHSTYDEARRAKSSSYGKAMGISNDSGDNIIITSKPFILDNNEGSCWWWLRSSSDSGQSAKNIYHTGWVTSEEVTVPTLGTRPALKLDLAMLSGAGSEVLCSYAGTVCSSGIVKERKADWDTSLSNPRIDRIMSSRQKVTWDCVWFGSYPQAEVVPASEKYTSLDGKLIQEGDLVRDDALYKKLQSAVNWDAQGDIELDGEKYRRIKCTDTYLQINEDVHYYQWDNETDYHYFKYQPIKWRVLSVNDSEAFLIADKALDTKQYHTATENVSWEKSTVRSWLNGYGASANQQNEDFSTNNFIDTAFGSSEKKIMKDSKVENRGANNSKDTVDKVFLLSEFEICADIAINYGFIPEENVDEARGIKSSTYTKALGVWSVWGYGNAQGGCTWLLRSVGYDDCATCVTGDGSVYKEVEYGDYWDGGIRPSLCLDLTALSDMGLSDLYSYAGKVCSDGKVKEMDVNGISFSNPRIVKDGGSDIKVETSQKVTWDCVWLGNYPQAEVVCDSAEYTSINQELIQKGDLIQDDALYQKLKTATGWDEQGDVVVDGEKYRRISKKDATYVGTPSDLGDDEENYYCYYQWKNEADYHYFKYQPIKWRVLSVDGSGIFLLADKVLDNKQYHIISEDVTWQDSTIRSWLNGYDASANKQKEDYRKNCFINTAFSTYALSYIKDSSVENRNSLPFDSDGGDDTTDKIFLLSESEVCREYGSAVTETFTEIVPNAQEYGFHPDGNASDVARSVKSSPYAKAMGTWNATGCGGDCMWWLRSPSGRCDSAAHIDWTGWVRWVQFLDVNAPFCGIRPALNLDFSALLDAESSNLWSYAGTVCSDGTVNEVSSGGQPSDDDKQDKATGVNVAYRTQREIRDYAKKSGVSLKDALTFAENPITAEPYALGKLSDKTLKSAADMLNQIRYIAGISDGVKLSDSYNELAQAAALSNYANNDLSHFPVQPAGMPDDMYALAKEGASSSNISWASWAGRSLNDAIVSGWMKDSSAGNIPMVGHRRWILNPSMGKTGFGAVSGQNGTYSAMYTFDRSNSGAQEYGVMWPAQNMPVEYFDKEYPWSISMGYNVDESKVQVALTRKKDGKKWSFSKTSADGDFYVNNDGYGQKGCIIFRPGKGLDDYSAGEEFKVEITGLEQGDVSYTVHFFALAGEETPTPKPTTVPDDPYIPYKPVIIPTSSPAVTPKPSVSPSVLPTADPSKEPSEKPSEEPSHTPLPMVTPEPSEEPPYTSEPDGMDASKKLKKGSKVRDKKTKAVYQVTGVGSNKAVEYIRGTQKGKKNATIPATVRLQGNTFKVTSIGKNAFKGNKKLKNVSIGGNVKKVGKGAFDGCKKLKKVTLGKNVAAIEANAFRGCSDLTMVTIPSKVKKIGSKAFYQCRNLRYIMVKTNKLTPKSIGKNAFSGGYRLPRVKTDKKIWRKYSRIFLKSGISRKTLFIIDPVKLVI